MNYKIIDNFLDEGYLNQLKQVMLSDNFNWYYQKHMTNTDRAFMGHIFFWDNQVNSLFYPIILPLLDKLEAHAVHNVRANLVIFDEEVYTSNWHTDVVDKPACKTAVYYLNTNNGITELYPDIQVESKENRMLIFDSTTQHRMLSSTDTPRRVVINFNYYT